MQVQASFSLLSEGFVEPRDPFVDAVRRNMLAGYALVDDYVVVDQDARYDGLLRFYVQGLEDRNVEYVKLRLYVSNQSTMGGKIFKCREDWHEDVVTWDSVPSIIDDKPLAIVKAALLDEWIEIDVSGLVQEDGRKFEFIRDVRILLVDVCSMKTYRCRSTHFLYFSPLLPHHFRLK